MLGPYNGSEQSVRWKMKRIHVESFGPISRADIVFGDLTVFVGPQASGKSLLMQLLKAVKDAGAVRKDLVSYGFDWHHGQDPIRDFCSLYFGGGLGGIVHDKTVVTQNGKLVQWRNIVDIRKRTLSVRDLEKRYMIAPLPDESVFLIPAQRVLVLQDGWPRNFMAYSEGDPYCMRRFSEVLRHLMEQEAWRRKSIFPQAKQPAADLKKLIDSSVYVGTKLKVDIGGGRKRIMLASDDKAAPLPINAWSAGQREFTPLLLGLYWLMPPEELGIRTGVDTVMIEEPEMGLHPQAVVSFGLLMLELLRRGYKVILSTHSPVVLDIVWAVRQLKDEPVALACRMLTKIFGLKRMSSQAKEIFEASLSKEYRTYFFEREQEGVVVRDISSLDPGDEEDAVAGWGGLSGFSGYIAEIVGDALSREFT